MRTFRRVCVYCGSSAGVNPAHQEAASSLGRLLVERGIEVVYGGGKVGLMGALADSVLEAGGKIYGVIPQKLLDREQGNMKLTELFIVEGMHARKTMMANMADAFIALPGGFGTLEELFECITWTQLNYHLKPVGVLNVDGFYDQLLSFVTHSVTQGFIRPIHQPLLQSATDAGELLEKLATVEIPDLGKWLDEP